MFARLSQEIVDSVLDHLHDDTSTLRHCALTCRSWAPTSQLHLFHSISVRGFRQSGRLLAMLSASPVLSRYVRCLEIGGCSRRGRHTHRDLHTFDAGCWLNSPTVGLRSLVPALAAVSHLTLDLVIWEELLPGCIECVQHGFPALKTVQIRRCQFNSSYAAADVCRKFPPLFALCLHNPHMGGPASPCLNPTGPRLSIRTLEVVNIYSCETTILDAFELPAIEYFHGYTGDSSMFHWLQGVSRGAGLSLRELKIRIAMGPVDPYGWLHLEVSSDDHMFDMQRWFADVPDAIPSTSRRV